MNGVNLFIVYFNTRRSIKLLQKYHDLKENTCLLGEHFPFNIFHNSSMEHDILHPHWHDNIEIIYVNNGHAIFYIGNKPYNAMPGDILFVNSTELHSGYSIDNTLVDYYAVVFNKLLISSRIMDQYIIQYISPFTEGKLLFPNLIEKSLEYQPLIEQLIKSIIKEFEDKNYGYELKIKCYIILIIINISRYFPSIPAPEKDDKGKYISDLEHFNKLVDYVDKHYNDKITIEQAAGIMHLSPNYFCKLFKKMTGRTFIEFTNLYRINIAEKLLRTSDLSVTEISEKMGFCDVNYFSKVYKRYKHYPPSQCRK